MAQLMKGETFKDALKLVRGQPRFEYPLIVEEKADEIRCRVRWSREVPGGKVTFESYAGKPLHNLEHFEPMFWAYFRAVHPMPDNLHHCTEFDVGVLVNGNFNDSYRYTRSSSGLPKEKFDKKTQTTAPALFPEMVQFIIFDLPENQKPFIDRMIDIDFAADGLRHYGLNCIRPARSHCTDEAQVWEAYARYRTLGKEGAMGKTLHHTYQRRRTFDWMKIKPSEDHDGQITGFNEAVSESGQPLGRVGSINVTCADGSTAAPSGIPHALGKELWENQSRYVGQWIEFYCMERDRQGGYRHPIYHRFREDK